MNEGSTRRNVSIGIAAHIVWSNITANPFLLSPMTIVPSVEPNPLEAVTTLELGAP